MDTTELRTEAIEVLDWAKSLFRPGTDVHQEMDAISAKLKDEATPFYPLHGGADVQVRNGLANLSMAAAQAVSAVKSAPHLSPLGLDEAEAMSLRAHEALLAFTRGVTFQQVDAILSGTWGDSDLGDAIHRLKSRLREAGKAALEPRDEMAAGPRP